jgi:hypothetical protein
MATSPLPHIKSETENNMNTSKSTKSNDASACRIRKVVIAINDDGDFLFYYPEDVYMGDDGHPYLDDYRDIEQPTFPGEPEPILALKKDGYSGWSWWGGPREWAAQGRKPNGLIAFTNKDARFLRDAAKPDDLIIRFKKS